MAFNPDTETCDNPMNVPSCSVDKPFTCPPVNGNYANPKNCTTFYLCLDGTASIYVQITYYNYLILNSSFSYVIEMSNG